MSFGNTKNSYDSIPKHKPVPDFPSQEKLRLEKELLGFYVSDHPLKSVLLAKPIEDAITLEQLSEIKKKEIKVIVMVAAIKLVTTKKNERMAILQVEDLTSQLEAVVFPKIYEKIHSLLEDNALLLITGKVDKRDEGMQILVEDAKLMNLEQDPQGGEEENMIEPEPIFRQVVEEKSIPVSSITEEEENIIGSAPIFRQVVEENSIPVSSITEGVKQAIAAQMVILQLTMQEVENTERLNSLKAILEEHSDRKDNIKVPVSAIVAGAYSRQTVRFGSQFWVENAEETVKRLISSGFVAKVS
jgi:DNA polymerase-3 subunit alpha